jgi:hypothetical protein
MVRNLSQDTNEDVVLERLEPLLFNRVGQPLSPEDQKKALAEGIRRFEAKEAPGFGDKDKKGDARAGDYLVWEQTLREAEVRRCSVVFVTDDAAKNDWYNTVSGQRKGPLPELSAELRRRADALLVMVPTSRLAHPDEPAADSLVVEPLDQLGPGPSDQQSASAELAPSVVAPLESPEEPDVETPPDTPGATPSAAGWTRNALEELLRRLAIRAPVQQKVLDAALKSDGFVSRQAVYELGAYKESRTLRGFTRPVTGACAQLRAEGTLPADAPDALEAVYDGRFSYVQAAGFCVPRSLLQLVE